MEFDASAQTTAQWSEYLKKIQHSNWMQTWPYAKAMHARDFKIPRTVLIRIDAQVVGLFILFEIRLAFIHSVEIQRGPLWFDDALQKHGLLNLTSRFASKLNELYPRSVFRRRRWLPEVETNEEVLKSLQFIGFKLRQESFSTSWVDLTQDLDTLRKKLDGKWRNQLNQAEKLNRNVQVDRTEENLDLFLRGYQSYKQKKNYIGLSPLFVQTEAQLGFQLKNTFFVWSYAEAGHPIAAIMISLHGRSASYRTSWNTDEGRKCRSHALLLWRCIHELKTMGFENFDLGGLLTEEFKNFNHFKLGLNGLVQRNINMLE